MNRDWGLSWDNGGNTAGLGTHWTVMRDKLVLGARYNWTKTTTTYDFTAGSVLPSPQALPDDTSLRRTLQLEGNYRLRANLALGLSYVYENFKLSRWATDNLDAGTTDVGKVLLLSGPVSDYHAPVLYTTVSFTW